jgi:hypothetical protein
MLSGPKYRGSRNVVSVLSEHNQTLEGSIQSIIPLALLQNLVLMLHTGRRSRHHMRVPLFVRTKREQSAADAIKGGALPINTCASDLPAIVTGEKHPPVFPPASTTQNAHQ